MSELTRRTSGCWPEILRALGILGEKAVAHKGTACPTCGGDDRFTFSDKDYGRWYCRGCARGGDGFDLIMMVKDIEFPEAARLVEPIIGKVSAPSKQDKGGAYPKDPMKSWRNGSPTIIGTLVDVYLRVRAIKATKIEARSLRSAESLFHWKTGTSWPAMLARVTLLPGGADLTTHQTFLRRDGSDKAPLIKDGKECSRLYAACDTMKRGGVWFGTPDPERELIVAEGIESTLSAMRLYRAEAGVAALSTSGLYVLALPPQARRVRIFADHDENDAGIKAATVACRRWRGEGREVVVVHARGAGGDANDLWRRRMEGRANG
jgi:putative DNA primase/helicase